jgi:hypothetical protein
MTGNTLNIGRFEKAALAVTLATALGGCAVQHSAAEQQAHDNAVVADRLATHSLSATDRFKKDFEGASNLGNQYDTHDGGRACLDIAGEYGQNLAYQVTEYYVGSTPNPPSATARWDGDHLIVHSNVGGSPDLIFTRPSDDATLDTDDLVTYKIMHDEFSCDLNKPYRDSSGY